MNDTRTKKSDKEEKKEETKNEKDSSSIPSVPAQHKEGYWTFEDPQYLELLFPKMTLVQLKETMPTSLRDSEGEGHVEDMWATLLALRKVEDRSDFEEISDRFELLSSKALSWLNKEAHKRKVKLNELFDKADAVIESITH